MGIVKAVCISEQKGTQKKNIGKALALYPTPVVVIGAMVNERPNWVLVAHVVIVSHDSVLVSLAKPHYTNEGIRENGRLSINLVNANMLDKADYMGSVSGHKVDKSDVFAYTMSKAGVPMIDEARLTITGKVVDIYSYQNFDNFIIQIEETFVDEAALNEEGKIDYTKVAPVLFDFPNYEYLSLGGVLGQCLSFKDKRKSDS